MYLAEQLAKTRAVRSLDLLTSRNGLSLGVPFTEDGEEKCHRVGNGDSETEFYLILVYVVHGRGEDLPACPISKKNHTLPVTFRRSGMV